MDDHDHGPRVVKCEGCGQERWCGSGPCGRCGAVTPCGAPQTEWNDLIGPPREELQLIRDVLESHGYGPTMAVLASERIFDVLGLEQKAVEFNAWEEERDRADAEEECAQRAESALDAIEAMLTKKKRMGTLFDVQQIRARRTREG